MFFYEYPTLSYHLKAVFYFIWYFLLCFSEIPFTIDCIISDTRYAFGNIDSRQSRTSRKRTPFDADYSLSERYALQSAAIAEGVVSNSCYAIGNRYAFQVITVIKSVISDALYSHGDCELLQVGTIIKRIVRDGFYGFGNDHLSQEGTTGKRAVKNFPSRYLYAP